MDRKLLIRLFLTLLYLCVLYNFNKCMALTLSENMEFKTVESVTINESVGVARLKTSDKKSMGRFKLTGYCRCIKCCGKTDGITSTGTKAKAGRTIAVDPDIIPYGSKVEINGNEYIAEDCGGAIKNNKVDIFFDSHEEALEFGVKYSEVYIKR